jgi:hypothetical protein
VEFTHLHENGEQHLHEEGPASRCNVTCPAGNLIRARHRRPAEETTCPCAPPVHGAAPEPDAAVGSPVRTAATLPRPRCPT